MICIKCGSKNVIDRFGSMRKNKILKQSERRQRVEMPEKRFVCTNCWTEFGDKNPDSETKFE